MAASLTQFAALNPPTATGQQLDDNFTLAGEQAPIPCVASGTNVITLVQQPNVITVPAYTNNMQISAVAAGTNTGATTAALGSLGALNVYKDTASGPVTLTGGEIVNGCAFTLLYDPVLNSGSGGFHLFASTAIAGTPISATSVEIGNSTITNLLSGVASLTFSAVTANSSQDQTFSVTGIPSALPNVGDFVQVTPPSLAAAGVGFNAMVLSVGSLSASTSAATINVRALNTGAASVTPPVGGYRYFAMRAVP